MPNTARMNTESPIARAARLLGGQSALAQKLGVTPPTVNQWINGSRQVPAERCPLIEVATDGDVTCEQLRPDVAWSVLRQRPVEQAEPKAA